MRTYILRRLMLMIPTIILVSVVIFLVVRVLPGDIVAAMLGQAGDVELDREQIERWLGLEAPLPVQYGRWMGVLPQADGSFRGVLQGELGMSWWARVPVVKLIAVKAPVTLELGLIALVIGQLIALPVGIYSAIRQDTAGDYISRSFAIMLISIPGFWLGTMIVVFPSIWWGYMPPIMLIPFAEDPIGNLKMFIVPALVLGMALSGGTMRMTRTMMLEVLRQDYTRTAWAKGLNERVVIVRHALKNALIPVVTIMGFQLPILIGGTVIIEQIFVLPGMGRLMINASLHRDFPLISGLMLIYGSALLLINLLVDLTYAWLDPRVRYR